MKRPSPALVISCVALFASLGGTGYAATRLHSDATTAKSKKVAKAVTKSEVNKLIAGYVKAHHIGAVGPRGPQGAPGGTGAEGKTGSQGPGAQRIDVEQLGELAATKIATVGLWTLTLTCKNTGLSLAINGPGQFRYTESFGSIGGTASTSSNEVTVDGFTSGVGNGAQQGLHGFLDIGYHDGAARPGDHCHQRWAFRVVWSRRGRYTGWLSRIGGGGSMRSGRHR